MRKLSFYMLIGMAMASTICNVNANQTHAYHSGHAVEHIITGATQAFGNTINNIVVGSVNAVGTVATKVHGHVSKATTALKNVHNKLKKTVAQTHEITRSVYHGLKQSGHTWTAHLQTALTTNAYSHWRTDSHKAGALLTNTLTSSHSAQ